MRWLHIYLSMAGLFAVLFFSLTGLTLNHPEWTFGQRRIRRESTGQLEPLWIAPGIDESRMDRLRIVETIRAREGARGLMEDFRVDDSEVSVSFQGPGHSAEAVIDRRTGRYRFTTQSEGWVAWVNDLHKGRHTGAAWGWMIDLSAIALVGVSVSGLALLLYLRRRRWSGLASVIGGTLLFAAVVRWLLP